jgi:ubiquinone/menaquinone biosynthesis C-methylase UbiE
MKHTKTVVDQFTRQASAYANAQPIKNEEILQSILRAADPLSDDDVLDVASGPGILTCALAKQVKHATGIDVTPAMLEQSRRLQAEQGLTNMTWMEGDVARLPFEDASFSLVTCRYAFHHFRDPLAVLKEMTRVSKPGGRVLVADTAPAPEKADAFNLMEKLRDNSHVRALPVTEVLELFERVRLANPSVKTLRMAGDLNSLLARSYCEPGDEERCRRLYEDSLIDDKIDMQPRRGRENILYAFPVAIVTAVVS